MTIFILMDQLYPINDKKEKLLIYVFGILFLILFGLRDFSVGTDTLNYIEIIENLDKFYFIKDGEELNPGKTVTVYKELCKQYFNITQEVHDLMTGYVNFHEMATNDRRNWFTRISDSDYTFALNYGFPVKNVKII